MSDVLRERVAVALGDAYEVGLEVGRGGMGVVYRATDRKLRREVAIKVLPPELAYRADVRQRFLREAQTAAQLSHPNIVPIYAVEERDGLVCFVMALVDGESLATRIVRDRQMSIDETVRILTEVAEALGYAHTRGIVHRDIKPDNILIDRVSGRAMVTDFGIARAAEGESRLTLTGVAVGTPAYMSPEQAMGDAEIDGRSDQYSLAIVGYQMLSGSLPFQAANTPGMLMKHISEQPRPLVESRQDAPPWLVHVLSTALSKKPAERFTSALAFRDALATKQTSFPDFSRPSAGSAAPDLRASSAWKHSVPRDAVEVARQRVQSAPRPLPAPIPPSAGRDAVEAANGGRAPVPSWMPPSWRDTRRQWDDEGRVSRRGRRGGDESIAAFDQLPVIERIRRFRRKATNNMVTIAMLATINMVFSPGFLWFLFPAIAMGFDLLRRFGSLHDDGVTWKEIYGPEARRQLANAAQERPMLAAAGRADAASSLAPPEVLDGPHGAAIRRAASDRAGIREAVNKLGKADREMIPDVLPTVDALVERVVSVAGALHRIDEDVRPGVLEDLDSRIGNARAQPESRERDQRIELLERQRTTLADLASRRETLVAQLESASLMLQSMRVDLIALRSAGVQSAIQDVSGATQEARALSRDIANVLDAARQVRG